MPIIFYKMSEYINTSLSPLPGNELNLYKQNLPMLPSEALIELCHLLFALIHFRIIFLQNISSTKFSPNVNFSQPMCLTCITFFHDEAVNTEMCLAGICMICWVTSTLLWLRYSRSGIRAKFTVSMSGRELLLNQLLAGVR